MGWKCEIGNRGAWRLHPMVQYWWEDGLHLDVHWRLPAAPFPAWSLRALERSLWEGANRSSQGFLVPDTEALLVYRAVQAARPGARYHQSDWDDFVAERGEVRDWDRVWSVAREARVQGVVRRSVAAAEAGAGRPSAGQVFDGLLGDAWSVAVAIQRRVRPSPLAGFLASTPRLGELTVRCRVNSTEILAGPGVFVPTPDADVFVHLVLDFLSGVSRPVVVEVGTGCGAIGLSVARERPDADVHVTDLSRAAVWWTKRNRRALGLRNVRVGRGTLLHPIPAELGGRVAVLLANLPYYPPERYAPIGGVPRDTIQGEGDDGLDLLRRLADEAATYLVPGGRLLLQMFDWQWDKLAPELVALGYMPVEPTRRGSFVICPADRV
jgi:methylase of polypeptide subunit release factors